VERKFTWYRPNDTARSRLDRISLSDLWIETLPGSTQYILSRSVSNHCALVIKNRIIDWGPKPFRAFDVWFEVNGYKDVIKDAYKDKIARTQTCTETLEGASSQ